LGTGVTRVDIAPYFDLRRGLWIPSVTEWVETTFWGVEGPEGFEEYARAVEASRFLALAAH
jgi:hypothetical protein